MSTVSASGFSFVNLDGSTTDFPIHHGWFFCNPETSTVWKHRDGKQDVRGCRVEYFIKDTLFLESSNLFLDQYLEKLRIIKEENEVRQLSYITRQEEQKEIFLFEDGSIIECF